MNLDFNKKRFVNFGRYDLIINKSFYITMALFTSFGALGITLVAFVSRWLIFRNSSSGDTSFESYSNTIVFEFFLIAFFSIMRTIFAGCTFHNLRNKQGRITELTLPATNLEKYVWHFSLVSIGGLLTCMASLLGADIINAILNLFVYPIDAQHSITY